MRLPHLGLHRGSSQDLAYMPQPSDDAFRRFTNEPYVPARPVRQVAPTTQPNLLTLSRRGLDSRQAFVRDDLVTGVFLMGHARRYIGFEHGNFPYIVEGDYATHGSIQWVPRGNTRFARLCGQREGEDLAVLRVVIKLDDGPHTPLIEVSNENVTVVTDNEGAGGFIDKFFILRPDDHVTVTHPDGFTNQVGWYGPNEQPVYEAFEPVSEPFGISFDDALALAHPSKDIVDQRRGILAIAQHMVKQNAGPTDWLVFCNHLVDNPRILTQDVYDALMEIHQIGKAFMPVVKTWHDLCNKDVTTVMPRDARPVAKEKEVAAAKPKTPGKRGPSKTDKRAESQRIRNEMRGVARSKDEGKKGGKK